MRCYIILCFLLWPKMWHTADNVVNVKLWTSFVVAICVTTKLRSNYFNFGAKILCTLTNSIIYWCNWITTFKSNICTSYFKNKRILHKIDRETVNWVHEYVGLCRNPNLAAKQKKTKEQQLKERPRFSSVAKTPLALGGFKPQI